jgi:intein-encoded DNA endonuclease-like protein
LEGDVLMEIVIPFDKLNNSQTITPIMDRIFKERGLDMSRHEVVKLVDDPDKKVRVLTIRPKTYIII